jgi:hypothetical protein
MKVQSIKKLVATVLKAVFSVLIFLALSAGAVRAGCTNTTGEQTSTAGCSESCDILGPSAFGIACDGTGYDPNGNMVWYWHGVLV